ncbi:MAG: AmmeMemoRadiSam system radical SAM enzyme [bacterium]
MREAAYYQTLNNHQVKCQLCPHQCIINPNKRGKCHVRKNIDGKLYSEVYGQLSARNFDPIEKKPLYHYYPSKIIYSIGSIGCNLACHFCQNCDISQNNIETFPYLKQEDVHSILEQATSNPKNIGIAYTYNEPTVWYEFMLDIARQSRQHNLKNIMISNGYIEQAPLDKLLSYMDAFNIDLKGFTETFYQQLTGASLQPVLETIKKIHQHGAHLELTNLIIPTKNDDPETFELMVQWIQQNTSKDTVLHLSRYFPRYKLKIDSTSPEKLTTLKGIAEKYLNHVYLGNI